MTYAAVVLDNDGVLTELPNRETMWRAAERTFQRFDLSAPSGEQVRALVAGNVEAIRSLCQEHRIDASTFCYEAAAAAVREQKRELRDGLRTLYDDTSTLWNLDAPLGLVSDNQHETIRFILRFFGIEERFDAVYGNPYTPEGLHRMKPDPHYLDEALDDLGTRDALYVGDSAVDVEAAANAGVDSALVVRDDDAPDCEPTHRIESLGELSALV
ncbi:HAD family hydrolase [Halomarina salina]|uniref:HAD family hydrolase n=1 Tax=Halomarina salina TaxID=1872699 RepID=A0ABD5RIY9_9EURY